MKPWTYRDVLKTVREIDRDGQKQMHALNVPIKVLDRLGDEGFDVFVEGDGTVTISWEGR